MLAVDLSIVVISYNTCELTRACLASIAANRDPATTQVIVVDNASVDGSAEMVEREFPTVELVRNIDNRGFAAANNQAFALAGAPYILLLNSDTVILGDVLDTSVAYLKHHPGVGAFGCRVLNADGSMQPTCSGFPTLRRLLWMTLGIDRICAAMGSDDYRLRCWARDSERAVEVVSGCYLMVRREVIDDIGGLDERFFFFGEETDWCRRIAQAGWEVRFAPVGEIIHYGGASVKKLNAKRDIMLTRALVLLHAKYGGFPAAAAAFAILALFNLSRALVWSLLAPLRRTACARSRHFRQVVLGTPSTWPRG